MKKKLLFVLFAVLTLAVGATAATSSVIERTGKSIKKERTAPARQVAKADADKSPTVYGWLRYVLNRQRRRLHFHLLKKPRTRR